MKKIVLAALAGALSSLAFASVAGACFWALYQPRVPQSLTK